MKQGKQIYYVTNDAGVEFDEYRLDAHLEKLNKKITSLVRMLGCCKVMLFDDDGLIQYQLTIRDGGEEI